MEKVKLSELDAHYLEFTKQKGVLRCLLPERDGYPADNVNRAQGLYFICPACKNSKKPHGVTLLFNLESVDPVAQPKGRWNATKGPLSNLTLSEPFQSPQCKLIGKVVQGKVKWMLQDNPQS